MHFDPDRLQVLAGVRSHTDYRYKKLQEMETKIVLSPESEEEQAMVDQLVSDLPSDEVEVETLPGMAAGASAPGPSETPAPELEAPEQALPDDTPEEAVMEEPMEETLRRIIRSEVRQIVSEEISKRDEKQLDQARKNKSVAAAMGYTASSPSPSTSQKRWQPTQFGFGPGFKR